jgi:uncharacterized membrane protein YoaK (UPF0700 family)
MPQEHSHHPSGPLVAAVTLAASAGFVDAHVYLHVVPVFVANMSGNLIHLGMAVGLADARETLAACVAIAAFCVGVAAGTVHHDRRRRRGLPVGSSPLLAVESAMLVALCVVLALADVDRHVVLRLVDVPILTVAAVAMGLQTASLRAVGRVAVATTYGTGAIVRIAEKSVLAWRGAAPAGDERRRTSVVVLTSVVVAYVAGAAIAAAAGASPLLVLAPAVAVAGCALGLRREPELAEPTR